MLSSQEDDARRQIEEKSLLVFFEKVKTRESGEEREKRSGG
jgi:hypothetical protein